MFRCEKPIWRSSDSGSQKEPNIIPYSRPEPTGAGTQKVSQAAAELARITGCSSHDRETVDHLCHARRSAPMFWEKGGHRRAAEQGGQLPRHNRRVPGSPEISLPVISRFRPPDTSARYSDGLSRGHPVVIQAEIIARRGTPGIKRGSWKRRSRRRT